MASDDQQPARSRGKRTLLVLLGIVAALVVVAGGFLVWYLNQPVPEEVSLESAVEEAAESDRTTGDTTQTIPESSGMGDVWTVDTSIGEFSFEEATSSFVGFRIKEELASIGATTAVGRTAGIEGSFTLTGTEISEAVFTADMTQIVTNATRRDRAVQRALDTDEFPTATFTLTEPIDIGEIPDDGETISSLASGDLEIMGTSRSIDLKLDAQIVGDLVVVVGAVDIVFARWGVEMPTAPGVVSVENHGILEIQLFFNKG